MVRKLIPSGTVASRVIATGALCASASASPTGASRPVNAWRNWKPSTYRASTRLPRVGSWVHSQVAKTWTKPCIQRTRWRRKPRRLSGVSSRVTSSSTYTTSTW